MSTKNIICIAVVSGIGLLFEMGGLFIGKRIGYSYGYQRAAKNFYKEVFYKAEIDNESNN